MRLGDKIVVPPGCPVEQAATTLDLRHAPFALEIHDSPSQGVSEVFASFDGGLPGEVAAEVQTSIDSVLHRKVWDMVQGTSTSQETHNASAYARAQGSGPIEHLRKALCKRVAECHGVTKEGKCWALGAEALQAAILEIEP